MIKKILLALVAVLVLLVGAAVIAVMMAPTDLRVEREITINRPRSQIYAYAKNLKNQNEWGPWFKKEPTMKQDFRGTDGEVGFVSHWVGTKEEVGEGEQEIKKLIPDERIETELRFKQPFESTMNSYLTLDKIGDNETRVKWGFTGSMPRPFNLFMLVMDMDKEVGTDFEQGLGSLKAIMEKQ